MAPDPGPDARTTDLISDLRALGRTSAPVTGADVAAIVTGVSARLAAVPAPSRPGFAARLGDAVATGLARYRRRVAVALVVVLLALTGVPAVRAAVADWFGFAGIRVRLGGDDAPPPSATSAPPPRVGAAVTLDEARALVSFTPLLPAALGPPDGVEVSADRTVLSMSWDDAIAGPVRLDQFAGGLDYVFAKSARAAEYTAVGGDLALWFEQPHAVSWLAGGAAQSEPPRLAGHTLIWERDGTALRLEGDVPLDRATAIAESTRPL